MVRRASVTRTLVLGLSLVASACATSPKRTVLDLDTTDPKWTSRRCVEARREVARWNDHFTQKLVLGTAGNLVFPFAGTGAALAWNESENKKRAILNGRVEQACITRRRPPAQPYAEDGRRDAPPSRDYDNRPSSQQDQAYPYGTRHVPPPASWDDRYKSEG